MFGLIAMVSSWLVVSADAVCRDPDHRLTGVSMFLARASWSAELLTIAAK